MAEGLLLVALVIDDVTAVVVRGGEEL